MAYIKGMAKGWRLMGLAGVCLCLLSSARAGLPAGVRLNADLGGVPVVFDGAASLPPSVKAVPAPSPGPGHELSSRLDAVVARLKAGHPEIPQAAVMKALRYLWDHADAVANKEYVGIVDFDRPSSEKRLSLIRLSDGSVSAYLVSHGRGSGGLYATRFSDTPRSHQSALGIYVTGDDYTGEHGRSLKLYGMEAGNDRAEARAIVVHSADYVTDRYVAAHGMAGRSWGCPAVDPKHRERIIDALLGGAVLLLHHSSAR